MLLDSGFALTESSAIVFYLAEVNGYSSPIVPREPKARARVMQWDRIADLEAMPIVMSYFSNSPMRLKEGTSPDRSELQKAFEKFQKLETTLDNILSKQKYLASPSVFTYADISMASALLALRNIAGPQPTSPTVRFWLDDAASRAALAKI